MLLPDETDVLIVGAAYEAARRPVALQVITMTDRLTRAANARNPLLRTVRNLAFTLVGRILPAKRRLAMDLSELSTVPGRHITAHTTLAASGRRSTAGATRTSTSTAVSPT